MLITYKKLQHLCQLAVTHGNSVELICTGMCIPSVPAIKMLSLSKEPGTIE